MEEPTQPTQYSQVAAAHMRTSFYATKPTWWTQFTRTFVPWQVIRFAWINLKMMKIIHRSHTGH